MSYYKVTFESGTMILLPAKSGDSARAKAKRILKEEGYKGGYSSPIMTEPISQSFYIAYHDNEIDRSKKYAIIEY